MSWTKKQLIDQAFSKIGLSSYQYDLQPEDAINAVITMDAIVGNINIPLSYNMANDPSQADPNQESGLPNWANQAVYLSLAIAMCPNYGKTASAELKASAQSAINRMYAMASSSVDSLVPDNMPSGQGNKPWSRNIYRNFINEGEEL